MMAMRITSTVTILYSLLIYEPRCSAYVERIMSFQLFGNGAITRDALPVNRTPIMYSIGAMDGGTYTWKTIRNPQLTWNTMQFNVLLLHKTCLHTNFCPLNAIISLHTYHNAQGTWIPIIENLFIGAPSICSWMHKSFTLSWVL